MKKAAYFILTAALSFSLYACSLGKAADGETPVKITLIPSGSGQGMRTFAFDGVIPEGAILSGGAV